MENKRISGSMPITYPMDVKQDKASAEESETFKLQLTKELQSLYGEDLSKLKNLSEAVDHAVKTWQSLSKDTRESASIANIMAHRIVLAHSAVEEEDKSENPIPRKIDKPNLLASLVGKCAAMFATIADSNKSKNEQAVKDDAEQIKFEQAEKKEELSRMDPSSETRRA